MTVKTKGKTISEAAADVLAASIKNAPGDSFGVGTKLFRSTGTNASPTVIDLGGAHTKTDQAFPDFTRGVPSATPPGATPPVKKEDMHTIEKDRSYAGKQPQKTEGKGDNHSPEGDVTKTAQQHSDRMEDNPFFCPTPGQGNKKQPWGHSESLEYNDEEFEALITEWKKTKDKDKEDKDDDNDGDEDDKNNFFDKFKDKKKKAKAKLSKEQLEQVQETFGFTDDQIQELLDEEEEEVELPSVSESLELISKEILDSHKEKIAEDIEAIFAGETLSEEFKTRVSTVFNAAVATRVNEVVSKLETVIVEQLDKQVDVIKTELSESVDEYLNYMVEEWMKDNEIAIQKGLKSEIVEDFIMGLRNLFAEHYIDIPEDKMDLVGEMQAKIEELEDNLNEEINRGIALKKSLSESQKDVIMASVCEGLTKVQADKIKTLSESVDFTTSEDFSGKLTTLRESYFPSKVTKQAKDALDRDPEILSEEQTITDPRMAAYVKIASNTKNI